MDCSVEGCSEEATGTIGSKDEYAFCGDHREAWGYYRAGYYKGKGFECDGLLRRKVWDAAMKAFLEHCRIEIAACTQIAEAIIRDSGGASGEGKYDGWLATMKIPAEVSALELSVLANRLGIDVDAIRNRHFDELYDTLLERVKEKGIIQEEG